MYSSVGSPHSVQVKDPKFGAVVNQQLALPSNSYFEAKKIESNENSSLISRLLERCDTNSKTIYSSLGITHDVVPLHTDGINLQLPLLPSNSSLLDSLFTIGTLNLGSKNLSLLLIP